MDQKPDAPRQISPTTIARWRFDEPAVIRSEAGGQWFHDKRGAGALAADLDEAIKQLVAQIQMENEIGFQDRVVKSMRSAISSGVVHARTGLEVLSEEEPISKTMIINLSTALSSGFAEGLRYDYEKVPSRQDSVDGVSVSAGWSKHELSKEFSWNLSRIADRFALAPKLGYWSFDSKLINSRDQEGKALSSSEFKISKGISFGMRSGVEWNSRSYSVLPWFGVDMATAVGIPESRSVLSLRWGADALLRQGPRFNWFGAPVSTAWSAFYFQETLALRGTGSSDSADEGEGESKNAQINLGFAGLGFALSW